MSKYHIVGNHMSRLVDHVDRPDKMDKSRSPAIIFKLASIGNKSSGEVRPSQQLSARQRNAIHWRFAGGPIVAC